MSVETKEKREPAVNPATNIETTSTNVFARQPLSVLGKIAFWTFLVGALSGLGGTITLTISDGYPSRDIVITTVCMLVGAILMATRIRWIPVVTSLVGGYLLYLIFTEPFVTESLANPKGPQGGFGHFVGDVVVCACTLVAFGASISAAVQNYRPGSRKAPRWLPSAWSGVAGMIIGAVLIGALSQPAAPTGMTYTNGMPTIHMSAGNFLQPSVTVPKGSKLLLVSDTSAVHTLFNGSWQNGNPMPEREPGAPVINNVQLSGSKVELGPFNVAGTYHIYCAIHPGMNLTIIVQ